MNLTELAYRLSFINRKAIVILRDNVEIDRVKAKLDFFDALFSKKRQKGLFYSYEIPPHCSVKPDEFIVSNRLKAIYTLLSGPDNSIVFTNINALIQPVIGGDEFIDKMFEIRKGEIIDIEQLQKKLINAGFIQTDSVEYYGEFSKKGFVVDLFSPFYNKPARIEFFDDEVERITLFFAENYRTFKELESLIVLPAKEYSYKEDEFGYALLGVKNHLLDYPTEEFEFYSNVEQDDVESLFRLAELYNQEGLFEKKERVSAFFEKVKHFELGYKKLFVENEDIAEKIERIKRAGKNNRVVVACGSDLRVERVAGFLKGRQVEYKTLHSSPFELPPGVYLSRLGIDEGLVDEKNRFVVVGFGELFGAVLGISPVRVKRKKPTEVDFEANDKVVHKRYGIAVFNGLTKIDVDGSKEEFFELEFEGGDKIYLPVYNADMLYPYRGSEPVSSLRNNRWAVKQENIKKSIKKILSELVNAYAKRKLIKREPFNVGLFEIEEFEAMFEYDETADQLKAIEDIKNDMSKESPMDRLICGDVSFGKTEVAMRAIAICVFNLRQAVLMVPTTILSLQHYKTLTQRFKNFPVNIALLNRFTTKKEREKILKGLKDGTIDILIATHSVYSKDVEFLNLGLVVVDEEHRFGVKVKEHLKTLYPHVDMLYLSATPIPRTLNMSLNGILDISVIKTPPLERKPIETIISKRKLEVIRDAVLREISREGRVYFVHNAIEDIEEVKEQLDRLLPFVKKEIVHAKMPKGKIKDVFERFNKGEFELLIATSIIESGLDIKAVDTIIIDDADRFGLSDLYQLRGRVGRGDRVSYAYLLYEGKISENAKKRLKYISEFIERGVGFNLALKDAEIRGYGNILGKDQSGKIKSIGYSTYLSLIEEAIREVKKQPLEREIEIKHSFDAYIPDEFASQEKKVEIYKRLSAVRDEEELEQLKNELTDRFGKLIKPVENLILITLLKIKAKRAFVKKLLLSKKGVAVEFYVDADIDTDMLIKEVHEKLGRFESETVVSFKLLGNNLGVIADKLIEFFERITKQGARRDALP